MNDELKQIIVGLVLFGIVLSIIIFLSDKHPADLSSDFEDRQGQFYQENSGHPLW